MPVRKPNSRPLHMVVNPDGFTLIEVFIAIFLLTVSLLGTAALTTGVIRGNTASRNMTTATAIAHSCLDENRRVGYTNAGAGSSGCLSGSVNVTQGGVTFARDLTVTPVDTTNIRTLTVKVSWSEGAVGTKSITLTTILAAAAS